MKLGEIEVEMGTDGSCPWQGLPTDTDSLDTTTPRPHTHTPPHSSAQPAH